MSEAYLVGGARTLAALVVGQGTAMIVERLDA